MTSNIYDQHAKAFRDVIRAAFQNRHMTRAWRPWPDRFRAPLASPAYRAPLATLQEGQRFVANAGAPELARVMASALAALHHGRLA